MKCMHVYFLEDLALLIRDLNQYIIVVPLFGAAYAAPNIGTQFYTNFPVLMSPLSDQGPELQCLLKVKQDLT